MRTIDKKTHSKFTKIVVIDDEGKSKSVPCLFISRKRYKQLPDPAITSITIYPHKIVGEYVHYNVFINAASNEFLNQITEQVMLQLNDLSIFKRKDFEIGYKLVYSWKFKLVEKNDRA